MSDDKTFLRNPIPAEAVQWTEFGFSINPIPEWIAEMQSKGILTMYKPTGKLRFHNDYGCKDVDYDNWIVKLDDKYKVYTNEEFEKEFSKLKI